MVDSLKRMKKEKKKSVLPGVASLLNRDMAMDLGTANTLLYVKGKGIVVNEPSVIAYNDKTKEIIAVGLEAKSYIGKTPAGVKAIRPLKKGVIDDFFLTKAMIKEFFLKIQRMNPLFKPKAVISVPAGITQVEKRAVVNAAEEVGIGRIYLIEEPMAAAIGAGLPIEEETGHMVIDIGGGTTEVGLISKAVTVLSESVRVAGDEMNESLIKYLQRKHGIQIGENSAEKCKIEAGSAYHVEGLPRDCKISGKKLENGNPIEFSISTEEIRAAMQEPINAVRDAVRMVVDKAPAKLLDDVRKKGIIMAGGGSLLTGINTFIEREVGIACRVAEDPLTTIVLGCGIALENLKKYKKVFVN